MIAEFVRLGRFAVNHCDVAHAAVAIGKRCINAPSFVALVPATAFRWAARA